jgi:predicted transcriptional regulator
MMAELPTRRQSARLERAAYHEAGHAVAAASFGCRFGMVALYPDAESESAITGPLQIDLLRCAFPPGQPERLLQVLTILWAGTAAETQFTGRRVAPEADPDRKTVEHFLERLIERGVTIPEGWDRRPRLDAHALLRQPKQGAAVESLAVTLLEEHIIGHFTARRIIAEAMRAIVPTRLRRVSSD